MTTYDRQTYKDKVMKPIPRILVRIDRGEDWVELCGDWQQKSIPFCSGSGNYEDWLDISLLIEAWNKADKAVTK